MILVCTLDYIYICIHIHAHMLTQIYIHIYTYLIKHTWIYIKIHTCIYTSKNKYDLISVCMCCYAFVWASGCMSMCILVCVQMAVPCFRYRSIRERGLPRIQLMVMKSCLRWVGHIVRMDDGLLSRHLYYGEMWEGKRSALKLEKRFKDTIKYFLKQSGLSADQWEKMASDRSKWRKLIHKSIESFENSRMLYSAYKCLIRKGEQGPALGPQNHHGNCDICGKLCLSLAGLKNHMRKCAKPILHPNNISTSKTDRLCQFCGKICRSLAGLKSHLRTHAI